MEVIDDLISVTEAIMKSKRKRHVLGGFLLSVSAFLTGLAITTMTIKNNDEYKEVYNE